MSFYVGPGSAPAPVRVHSRVCAHAPASAPHVSAPAAPPAPPAPAAPPADLADPASAPSADPADPEPQEVMILDWIPANIPVSIIYIFGYLYIY